MAHEFWLSDAQWSAIELVLPKVYSGARRDDEGWRLRAKEIEDLVVRSVRKILTGSLPELVDSLNRVSGTIAQAVRRLPDAIIKLEDEAVLRMVVNKVELYPDELGLTLGLDSLIPYLVDAGHDLAITRHLPIDIKRRGAEMRLIVQDETATPQRTDQTMIKAVANGHGWYADWSGDDIGGMREIAERNQVSRSRVADVMKLAFLSPKIVESIVAGKQPAGLVTDHLLTADLPLSWAEQERRLGF